MWILRAIRTAGSKGISENIIPPVEDTTKLRFNWPEELRPLEGMPHAVVREFTLVRDRLTIVVPGYRSSGEKPKYEDIISDILIKGDSAVISTNNPDPYNQGLDVYANSIREQVIALVDYAIINSKRLTGRENAKITLYGSSAGGGAVALVAGLYPDIIDSVILTGPSLDVTEGLTDHLLELIRPFPGKVFFIRSEGDLICNPDVVREYSRILGNSRELDVHSIPGNDHAFESPENHEQLRRFLVESFNSLKVVEQ
ncbi:MAG: alpha/beta hydrolase [Candidatus Dojkabacteria bacterium]